METISHLWFGLVSLGTGHSDIFISSDSNIENSHCNFGNSYDCSSANVSYDSENAKNYLAGSYKFTTKEYEVFEIIF